MDYRLRSARPNITLWGIWGRLSRTRHYVGPSWSPDPTSHLPERRRAAGALFLRKRISGRGQLCATAKAAAGPFSRSTPLATR